MPTKLYVVNAFTAHSKHGNPAGVVLGAEAMDEKKMLAMAAEVDLSETAFVSSSDTAAYRVRFFTPTVEVPLCGHATIATWSLLHQLGQVTTGTHMQETNAGLLQVTIRDDGLTFMEQAEATFFETIAPTDIAPLLGIPVDTFHAGLSPRIVSTGIRDLLVPVNNTSVLGTLQPDLEAIAAFSRQHDISGFHVFAMDGSSQSLASARNFAPADGIPEESATGTSNGALLCYLKHEGVLPERDVYRIEQGEAMGQLSYVYGTFKGGRVWVGGEATVIEEY